MLAKGNGHLPKRKCNEIKICGKESMKIKHLKMCKVPKIRITEGETSGNDIK